MKNILWAASAILLTAAVFAQDNSSNARVLGTAIINPNKRNKQVEGTPYAQKMFASATVEKINVKAFMRYNIQADEFEFITPKNDTLILDRNEDFSSIFFTGLNKRYKLTQYVRDKKLEYGYLLQLYAKGDYELYKKENVTFVEEKVAKTTLETSMPARYTKQSDRFFLKNAAAGVVDFPDSKKALLKLFPDKKDAIETFLKSNKIDFDLEADLIRIVNLLAQ